MTPKRARLENARMKRHAARHWKASHAFGRAAEHWLRTGGVVDKKRRGRLMTLIASFAAGILASENLAREGK